MTEVLSSRKLREVPAFKGKDVTRQELTSAAESCPALQALKKSPKETSAPHEKAVIYQPLGLRIPNHPTLCCPAHCPNSRYNPGSMGCNMDREGLGKARLQPLIWPAPGTPSGTLRTVSGGKWGGFSILLTHLLLALKANHCHHLNYMIRSLIQYSQAHCLRVEHLAETLSQSCSNLAGEELILTISTFSFSIEYECNQVNFC